MINQIKQNTDEDLIEDSDLLVYEDKRKLNFTIFSAEQFCCFAEQFSFFLFFMHFSDSSDSDVALEESSDDQWDDADEDDSDEKMES